MEQVVGTEYAQGVASEIHVRVTRGMEAPQYVNPAVDLVNSKSPNRDIKAEGISVQTLRSPGDWPAEQSSRGAPLNQGAQGRAESAAHVITAQLSRR